MYLHRIFSKAVRALAVFLLGGQTTAAEPSENNIEQVRVWGTQNTLDRLQASSVYQMNPEDFASINATTLEDLVQYIPSLIIRRRYIGDATGTVGMRGSNMFQTPRVMVFVDGVPIHYHLQTRWSGAPRWSMVAPNEVGHIDVVYGPFSAEYSGNAMAGVINIETVIPTQQEFHAELSAFNQQFEVYGFDDNLPGVKGFASYGNYWNGVSVYASYNYLNNESHPQTLRIAPPTTPQPGAIPVSGAIFAENEYTETVAYFGDTGSEHSTAHYGKLKVGYETGNWMNLVNLVYEQRETDATHANNYLRDMNGAPVWQDNVVQNGMMFEVLNRDFSIAETQRESLMFGARTKGEFANGWQLEASVSAFENLKEETEEWDVHPLAPGFDPDDSTVFAFDELAWRTADIKLNKQIETEDWTLQLDGGLAYNQYQLFIDGVSGGETLTQAAYVQIGMENTSPWSAIVGVRFDDWQSRDGFYGDEQHPDRQEHAVSPKFSLAYAFSETWQLRYSYAQAYRFPIVEELFQNQETARQQSIANIDLAPEFGHHHNLMLNKDLDEGYLRLNIFYETVEDAIDAQSKIVDNISVRTFLPIDEVETKGVELVYTKTNVMALPLDVQANVTYAKAQIAKNAGGDQSFVGKDFPRMPHWRANALLTYHISDAWNVGGGIRYSSNSYGDADNADMAENVFGAFDSYTFVNVKTQYQFNATTKFSAGIDNLMNKIAYVHHPWPGRTFYLSASIQY